MGADRSPVRSIGILAGGGAFPVAVADSVRAAGGLAFLIGIRDEADPAIEHRPHAWIARGQLGTLFSLMRKRKLVDLVMIGGITARRMPYPWELDLTGLVHLWRHRDLLRAGDDTTLRRLARLIEAGGLRVIAAADVAPDLVMGEERLGATAVSADDRRDIAVGFAAARAHGARDLGQGVIVVGGEVVRREDRRGTDAMLMDHAEAGVRGGVLVKCLKPQQDRRLDMPALGPRTLDGAARAGLNGIAVEAGGTLILNKGEIATQAHALGVFVIGVPLHPDAASPTVTA